MKDDEEAPLSEEHQLYLEVAEGNAHRLLGLVSDLLYAAQADSGGCPLTVEDVAPGDLISNSIDWARPITERAGVRLAAEVDPEALPFPGDRRRLGQAIDNPVSNAIRFTGRGGSVRVRLVAAGRDGHVEITVADTGMGIPAAELDKLFTRSFRATTATANGMGSVWSSRRPSFGRTAENSTWRASKGKGPCSPAGCRTARQQPPQTRCRACPRVRARRIRRRSARWPT